MSTKKSNNIVGQRSLIPDVIPNEPRSPGYVRKAQPNALSTIRDAFPGVKLVEDDREREEPTPSINFKSTRAIGGCEHPIQLAGVSRSVNGLGEITGSHDVAAYASCKTRRATRCEPCSQLYQHDARHLIAAGLRGGKGIDEDIATHPAVFVTFTAPSFGLVHGQRDGKSCRPRRDSGTCPHGNSLACWKTHDDKDDQLGQPLCPDCFDYEGAVLWNNSAPALWRITRINLDREIAKRLGLSGKAAKQLVKTQYVKVVEFQRRGLVHFHITIRLDADSLVADQFDDDILTQVITEAALRSDVEAPNGQRVTWGKQLDIQKLPSAELDEEQQAEGMTRGRVSNYLAKYATKGSDVEGKLDRRFKNEGELRFLNVNDHLARMVRTSWKLAREYKDAKLDHWSHQLGYRGHFLTKSRNWSTTFKALRQVRKDHQEELRKASWEAVNDDSLIITKWAYSGSGYRSEIDAQMAEAIRNDKSLQRRLSTAA